jgi:hypothetical protein
MIHCTSADLCSSSRTFQETKARFVTWEQPSYASLRSLCDYAMRTRDRETRSASDSLLRIRRSPGTNSRFPFLKLAESPGEAALRFLIFNCVIKGVPRPILNILKRLMVLYPVRHLVTAFRAVFWVARWAIIFCIAVGYPWREGWNQFAPQVRSARVV